MFFFLHARRRRTPNAPASTFPEAKQSPKSPTTRPHPSPRNQPNSISPRRQPQFQRQKKKPAAKPPTSAPAGKPAKKPWPNKNRKSANTETKSSIESPRKT
jgi:hypothetical protein